MQELRVIFHVVLYCKASLQMCYCSLQLYNACFLLRWWQGYWNMLDSNHRRVRQPDRTFVAVVRLLEIINTCRLVPRFDTPGAFRKAVALQLSKATYSTGSTAWCPSTCTFGWRLFGRLHDSCCQRLVNREGKRGGRKLCSVNSKHLG